MDGRSWGWLAAALVVLSGCTSSDDAAAPQQAAAASGGGAPGTANGTGPVPDQPPTWRVGDWWKYRFESRMGGVEDTDLTIVVAQDSSTEYVTTLAETEQIKVTFFTHVPSLGPVRKSDLAVTRHGHFVPFLKFPLADGATWQVEVRGTWTATAHKESVQAGSRTFDGWRVEYKTGDTPQHVIEWSAEVGAAVREASHFGDAEPRHTLTLVDWGHNWTGPLRVTRAVDLLVRGHFFNSASPNATEAAGQEEFTAPARGDGMLLGAFYGGADGQCGYGYLAMSTALKDYQQNLQPCAGIALDWVGRPHVAGPWRAGWLLATTEGFLFFESFALTFEAVTLS